MRAHRAVVVGEDDALARIPLFAGLNETARAVLRNLPVEIRDFGIVGDQRNRIRTVLRAADASCDVVITSGGVSVGEADRVRDVVAEIGPEHMPATIFVTAYDQYALKAFEVAALDYLVKPFDDERFEQAVGRAQAQLRHGTIEGISHRLLTLLRDLSSQPAAPPADPEPPPPERKDRLDRLAVRAGNRWHVVDAQDIDWIEGAGVYVRLHVGKKSHLLRETLTNLEQQLDPDHFVRIHRSTIVNVERVRELKSYFHGEYIVYLNDGTQLKLSRSYREKLFTLLGQVG